MKDKLTPSLITGIGAVTPFGIGVDVIWENVLSNQSCIKNGLGEIDEIILKDVQSQIKLSPKNAHLAGNKAFSLAIHSIKQAMIQAGWESLNRDDGIIFSSTTGFISFWEDELTDYLNNEISNLEFIKGFKQEPLGSFIDSICDEFEFNGRRLLVTTACSASTQALGLAHNWISSGKVKRCLVGATEVLSTLTTEGFKSFQLVSPSLSKPFDQDRNGINLSEGSAFICMESECSSTKAPLASIAGGGYTCDAHHMTAPHPEGDGCARAIQAALKQAKIAPSDISWIHAHGTGSQHNDVAESNAISKIFGDSAPIVSSTKSIHGHALAASGVIETTICIQAIKNNLALRTSGLNIQDQKIYVPLIRENEDNRKIEIDYILKTTLGFGGANAAIIIGKVAE